MIDASAVTELLLGRPAGADVAGALRAHHFDLHAPHLLDVEVMSALRRLVLSGEASAARGADAVTDLLDLPLERYAHDPLLPRMWSLRDNLSTYDAAYVALAEVVAQGGVPLLTADGRLARAARELTDVEVILAT